MEFPPEFYFNYIERRRQDLKVLESALKQNQIKDFQRIGHQVKGNAPSFGFDDLAEVARRMEKVSSENIQTVGLEIINDFKRWLESMSSFKIDSKMS